MSYESAYKADSSLKGKLRRRLARLAHRRPLAAAPGRPMLSISSRVRARSPRTTSGGQCSRPWRSASTR